MVHRRYLVHVRRLARERVTWCGARPERLAVSLEHAAQLSTDPDLVTCGRCAAVAAAAVLAGAQLEQVSA